MFQPFGWKFFYIILHFVVANAFILNMATERKARKAIALHKKSGGGTGA